MKEAVLIELLYLPENTSENSQGLWRTEIQGLRKNNYGAPSSAHPAWMSEYLLEWAYDGRATDRWVQSIRGQKYAPEEVAAQPNVGLAYRLPVLGQVPDAPSPEAKAQLSDRARAASARLRAWASSWGLLVNGRTPRRTDPREVLLAVQANAWRAARALLPNAVSLSVPVQRREEDLAEIEARGGTFQCEPDEVSKDPIEDGPHFGGGVSTEPSGCLDPVSPIPAQSSRFRVERHVGGSARWYVTDSSSGTRYPASRASEEEAQALADQLNRSIVGLP